MVRPLEVLEPLAVLAVLEALAALAALAGVSQNYLGGIRERLAAFLPSSSWR